jgi:hypothetical protein
MVCDGRYFVTPILGVIASSKLTSSPYNGYVFGGWNGTANVNTIIKFNFGTETASTLVSTLTSARASVGTGFNNNGVAGYAFAGGGTTNETMDKLTYATETCASSTAGPAGQGRNYGGGIDNTATASYAAGGEASSPLTYYSNYLKFTFSNATWSTGGNQQLETNSRTGNENGSTAGYHWANVSSSFTTARKVTFSNDSWSNSFTTGRIDYGGKAPSNGTTASYQFGGMDGGTGFLRTAITKVTLGTESVSTLSATLSTARRLVGGVSDWQNAAYSLGGTDVTNSTNIIQKLVFSGETISTLAATLPYSVYCYSAASNHA